MESLFGYDTHGNVKVSLARKTLSDANGAQVTFLLSSMFAEETVKTAQVEMLLVAPVM